MENRIYQVSRVVLIIIGLAVELSSARAQQVSTLIEFTNVWKYNDSGLDLGTAWRTNDYDDADWPAGAGLLGVEPDTPQAYTNLAPISTPLVISSTTTTFYFRTTFEFTGSVAGVSLFATNLIDDGAAIYLNGELTGSVRMPPNPTATSRATGGPGAEGQLDVVPLNLGGSLREGTNLLAVEVHQSSVGSTDIMWGMKLAAVRQLPLTITTHPEGRTVVVGEPVIFSVEISGGPVFYRWQKDGANISGATGPTYTIADAQIAMSGDYTVVVSNAINSVTSNPAKLLVLPDLTGPRLLSATVRPTANATNLNVVTNLVIITFSEHLHSGFAPNSPTTNRANYRITRCGTTDQVVISNATHQQNLVQLRVGGPNWVYRDCYHLTVNNVPDLYGNRIAPDSQIPIAWPVIVDLTTIETPWSFHSSAVFEPGVYNEDWASTNFVESIWWAQGTGTFYGGPEPTSPCLGGALTLAGFQPEPTLFRTTFQWPSDLSSTAQLQARYVVNDGMVLYLNGAEIWRNNVAIGTNPVSAGSRATANATLQRCVTNVITVSNLVSGLNCLGVAVLQSTNSSSDFLFGLSVSAIGPTVEAPIVSPTPTLAIHPHGIDSVRLSWTGGGYALESTTNLTENSASYPQGPWQEVPNMSNPYTNSFSSPERFFRLKR